MRACTFSENGFCRFVLGHAKHLERLGRHGRAFRLLRGLLVGLLDALQRILAVQHLGGEANLQVEALGELGRAHTRLDDDFWIQVLRFFLYLLLLHFCLVFFRLWVVPLHFDIDLAIRVPRTGRPRPKRRRLLGSTSLRCANRSFRPCAPFGAR